MMTSKTASLACALLTVALIGIPILVVMAITPRWSLRAIIGVILAALLGALLWSSGSTDDIDAVSLIILIVAIVAAAVVVVVGGMRSAWSWIVAALFYQALVGLREAGYGPVWQARVAGALAIVVASVLVVLIARQTARTQQSSGMFV